MPAFPIPHEIMLNIHHSIRLLTLAASLVVFSSPLAAKTVKVFILAGQSNMQGMGEPHHIDTYKDDPLVKPWYAKIKEADGWAVRDDVFITYPVKHKGAKHGPLTVGYGDRSEISIGPEFGFGHAVGEAYDEPVLLIKVAWGGKSVYQDFRSPSTMPSDAEFKEMIAEMQEKHDETVKANEERKAEGKKLLKARPVPTLDELKETFGHFYREVVSNVKKELADFETKFPELKGYEPELAGLIWHQGFNDMVYKAVYQDNNWTKYTDLTAAMIKDLRKDLNATNLPVVIGELGTGGIEKRGDFQAAQAAIAQLPEFKETVVFVETAQYLDMTAFEYFKKGFWKGTEEEKAKWSTVGADRPYHYMGSGKTYFLKGVDFGEAMMKLSK